MTDDRTSTRGRLNSLQTLVRDLRMPDIVRAVPLVTMGCGPFQRAEIEHHAAKLKAQQEQDARARAAQAAVTDPTLERDVRDLETWRTYRAANPFEQARLRQQHGAAIDRGRALDEPEPPRAA